MTARIALGIACGSLLSASEALVAPLPDNEILIAFNTYSDSFDVDVIYPLISLTQRVSATTAVSARYRVDAITTASMRSHFEVDGITSATRRDHGGDDRTPDELHHEVAVGLTRSLGSGTWAAHLLYGTEYDYTSVTLAANLTHSLNDRNTDLQIGLLRSWDEVYPRTRDWRRDKNVVTIDLGLTQVITRRAVGQIDFTYSDLDGYLSDPYQVVTVIVPQEETATLFETRHPSRRIRRSLGLRGSVRVTDASSLQAGYRYYWDSWDLSSDTISGLFQHHFLDRRMTVGLGVRSYVQSSASFFEPGYSFPQRYMAADSRLDSGHSHEYELRLRLAGSLVSWLPGVADDRTEITGRTSYYRRRTANVDWHSRRSLLTALITSVGFRHRF